MTTTWSAYSLRLAREDLERLKREGEPVHGHLEIVQDALDGRPVDADHLAETMESLGVEGERD